MGVGMLVGKGHKCLAVTATDSLVLLTNQLITYPTKSFLLSLIKK
jgi:hypothetical protein